MTEPYRPDLSGSVRNEQTRPAHAAAMAASLASYGASGPGRYPPSVTPDLEAGVRIAWSADGFELIHVQARWRSREELDHFARGVADVALFHRTLPELRTALRGEFPGQFELETAGNDGRGARVIVRFHPPPGEPNPDPYV